MKRRNVLTGLAAGVLTTGLTIPALGQSAPRKLAMPPLTDARRSGTFRLEAQMGRSSFADPARANQPAQTWGFNQPFLGPTLRLSTGQVTRAEVANALDEPISVHWHGLLVPGEADGGPHQPIAPGDSWRPELDLTQPAATAWYHSHVHGATARQVMMGLAGVLQIDDGRDDDRGLPATYGVDDLTLVIQDRRFDSRGEFDLSLSMPDRMMGFLGDTILINGQIGATAVVPRGLVRLRLLNGSNARIYPMAFADRRPMHLIATDSGYLDQPETLTSLILSPGERAELLVDFSDGTDIALVSAQNPNRGMMGRGGGGVFTVLPFAVDDTLPVRITSLPDDLGGSRPDASAANLPWRRISLDMPMGMGGMFSRKGRLFSINGASFDMGRINMTLTRGAVERWSVAAHMMMHPFHIHGVRFQVLSENGAPPHPQNTGWKDTVLINGSADLLVRFDQTADHATPFMYHCHILEHEDGGMMGQFTVT